MTQYKHDKVKRNKFRKINYERGKFGCRRGGYCASRKFNRVELLLIQMHIMSDRQLAKLLHTTTNGIQACRWRIRKNYMNMYEK